METNPLLKKTNLIPAASNTTCIFCNQEMNNIENLYNHQKEVHNFNRVLPIIDKNVLDKLQTIGRKDNIILEILITTIDERENSFLYLIDKLSKQITNLNLEEKIRISFFKDNRQISTGKKRNILIEKAIGRYVVFIDDDDDDISDNYVKLIYDSILKNPDCVGIVFIQFCNEHTKFSVHSIDNKTYSERGSIFYRLPNHLSPMKRELIKDIKYKDKSIGEDTEFAIDLFYKKTFKTEEFIEEPIYYHKKLN